ncbi:MAG: M48 family metalloprotease [Bacteroidia bacterium]|jgi:predicted Zn-dependent protease
MYKFSTTLSLSFLLLLSACSKDSNDDSFNDPCGGSSPGGFVSLLISTDDDIQMGMQTVNYIESDTSGMIVMDSIQYKEAYRHIYRIRDTILNSGKVYYKNTFPWRIRLIKDDKTLNAFCTPGGFIYVYTGIIKYLDNETQLAGVMGHEIAHADRRHSARQIVSQYGIIALLSILSGGDPNMLAELSANLVLLKFSREHESEADDYSVRFLYPTVYDPRGAKYFFEKIGSQGTPEFLSTHPDPGNRVIAIENKWSCLGGRTDGQLFDTRYQQFKASLP